MSAPTVRRFALRLCFSFFAAGCASAPRPAPTARTVAAAPIDDPAPKLRLPDGVRPLAYTLELTVIPTEPRFRGRTQIAIANDAPRDVVWLHGKDLHVTRVIAHVAGEQWPGRYEQVNDDGLAKLSFERPLPVGQSVLELEYDAAFDRQLHGLFRVDTGGDSYVFSQFEATSARAAFPCFDEPGFKAPFDVWLTVPKDDVAASNTHSIGRELAGEHKRIHFAQTKPLPTYLVALAVGPLDVVEAPPVAANELRTQPVPVRGLCPKGKGPLLAHALAQVAPTLTALERYFGIAYPFDKLDIVAVPDFGPGAMENAGLVTFRDWLLLVDPKEGSEAQRRANAFVMAHEFAHQWFGDLVTMHYWDDIWLNEAFATWMAARIVGELHPEYDAQLELLDDMEYAMRNDSRVSSRMIRQPIVTTHDIMNAFDTITYNKGGAVIGMFERYLGGQAFQKGIQLYLRTHAFGNATTEDLLAALSQSTGRDVTTAFMSFLTQVGVPLVETRLQCGPEAPPSLVLQQSRYLPLGSRGTRQQVWQIPVCARYEADGALKQSCTLLTEAAGALALDSKACPQWLLPNADGAGYYRYTLPSGDLQKLRSHGLVQLSAAERLSLAHTLDAGFVAGSVPVDDLLASMSDWAADAERSVATVPISRLSSIHDEIVSASLRPRVEAFSRRLYAPLAARLGVRAKPKESGDTKLLRAKVLSFLAEQAGDAKLRARLARQGRDYLGVGSDGQLHLDAVPTDLADLAVRMYVQTGKTAAFDAVYDRFVHSDDAALRGKLLRALASVRDARSQRALALTFDPALRVNEVMIPLREQLSAPQTRDAAYDYFEQNFGALSKRLSPQSLGSTPWFAAALCDDAMVPRVRAFFDPRVASLPGGPRSLQGALESLQLCSALVKAQRPSVDAYFRKH